MSKQKAVSTLEYMTLLILLMAVLLFFGKYIFQAFAGRWRSTGETFGMGMQYDPQKTTRCRYDTYASTGMWYNVQCFYDNCDCHTLAANATSCHDCIVTCSPPECIPE